MAKYNLIEDGTVFRTVEADDADSALAESEPDYADYGDGLSPQFVTLCAVNIEDRDDDASQLWVLNPPEPECSEPAHDWQRPQFLGGLRENPGVYGHGGGVVIHECCMHCGCRKTTDTWAQDPSDGSEGHHTVAYERGYYAEQLEAMAEESA